jgi:hypothetical protein
MLLRVACSPPVFPRYAGAQAGYSSKWPKLDIGVSKAFLLSFVTIDLDSKSWNCRVDFNVVTIGIRMPNPKDFEQ